VGKTEPTTPQTGTVLDFIAVLLWPAGISAVLSIGALAWLIHREHNKPR